MKFLAFLAIAIYLICSLSYIDKPGLYYDETLFVNVALGNEDGSFIDLEAPIGPYRIPVMLMPYIGALKSYFYFPIFKIFGTSPATVRIPPILLALITFALTFLTVRNTLGLRTALATIVLFATDPAFIFINKLDLGPIGLMMLFKMLSLFLLFRWLKHGQPVYLYLAAFVIGLGIFDKAVFLWYVAAVTISFTVLFWPHLKTILTWKKLALCALIIVPFMIPSIISNVRSSWNIFNERKVLNTEIIKTFEHRRVLFNDTLNGIAIYEWVNSEFFFSKPTRTSTDAMTRFDELLRRFPLQKTLMAYGAILIVLLVPIVTLLDWIENRRYFLFYFLLLILTASFIYITEMATGPHHIMMLYPFHQILLAGLLFARKTDPVHPDNSKKGIPFLKYLQAFCFILLLFSNLVVDARYLTSFALKGGAGAWSDSIYKLAEYAETRKDKTFLLMDWGLGNPLLVLNRKRINKQEVAIDFRNFSTEEEKLLEMNSLFEIPNALFIFYVPKYESQPSLHYFKKALDNVRHEYSLSTSINESDGNPVYLIYELGASNINSPIDPSCLRLEAESFSNKSGGNVFSMDFTSNGNALADYWGYNLSDYASYEFSAPHNISNARISIRYSYEEPISQTYYLYLDNKLVDVIIFQSSGGFGHSPEEWKIAETGIGSIRAGNHLLTIKPSKEGQVINLDYFSIGQLDACSSREKY